MKALMILKRIVPFVLLFAITLPMSQCTSLRNKTTIYYVYSDLSTLSIESLTPVLALIWPFVFLILVLFRKHLDDRILFKLLELLLCALSVALLFFITLFQEMLVGGVIVTISMSLYFLITGCEISVIVQKRRFVKGSVPVENTG